MIDRFASSTPFPLTNRDVNGLFIPSCDIIRHPPPLMMKAILNIREKNPFFRPFQPKLSVGTATRHNGDWREPFQKGTFYI